jgi:drug/metabolite transporter (DMT)-like permease
VTGYAWVAATVALTAYGQLVIKWRVGAHGPLPEGAGAAALFLLRLLLDPLILSGLIAAFVAALAWMAALTQLPLSRAYPLMSLSFVLVVALSAWLLSEPLSVGKMAGVALIVLGTVVIGYAR